MARLVRLRRNRARRPPRPVTWLLVERPARLLPVRDRQVVALERMLSACRELRVPCRNGACMRQRLLVLLRASEGVFEKVRNSGARLVGA